MSEQVGKQALRSQEWIQTALFQLMEKKAYSHISITEITDRAGLARQTFYRNYQDKDEILLNYLDSLMKGMWENVGDTAVFNEEMFVILFRNWKSNAPSSLIYNIELKDRKIRQLIYKSICDFFDELSMDTIEENNESPEYTYRFYAHKSLSSIVHLMLIEWTLNHFHLSPEEIGRLVSDLTVSIRAHL
ncbi:TetR/AcrR family transcriptional regulator [Paenibacillus sp. UNC451MF]|uniref:TetR/AcrR family transcriptional regulator n=1 Tax=Paenibacillus sp. UNC451MF TaxID=1449063 RepID=UPI00048E138A|nr:TetR/AcrR family transcriptional regulator [Paenibacillus sp. UNC451MF]